VRTFCERKFAEQAIPTRIVQSSTIHSPRRQTLRGVHYQEAPHSEIKLVRCTRGSIFLVMVDLRPASRTRNKLLGAEMCAREELMAYVPEGARGARWNDPAFAIEWPAANERLISERDQACPDHSG
jgi:dTDP-4-dehydrorhamnose 3,5-epimerase